jgi:putative metalloprotease
MIDLLTDDELKAVLAYQIGHIAAKDVRNNMLKAVSKENAGNAGAAQLQKVLSMTGDGLGTIVNEAIQIPYTVDQCKAADQYACNLLKANGVAVSNLASALKKFAAMEAADADETNQANGIISVASKYNKVNPDNAARAALVK